MASQGREAVSLVPEITCPHCWHRFPPDQLHFIAVSPDLGFDHRLAEGMRRFLPSRFTFRGDAIDPLGGVCTETACPNCHLKIPRLLSIRPTLSFSVFGAPGSGKSYYLGAKTRVLGQLFPRVGLLIDDVDAEMNAILHEYERRLFEPVGGTVTIPKTDTVGDWYNKVVFGRAEKLLPQPFLHRIEPADSHPLAARRESLARVVCLYDNAGESFEPGAEKEDNPVTRHMSVASGLFFVFDPTKEQGFKQACRGRSDDEQWLDDKLSRQATLFSEAIGRIQRFRSLMPTDRISTPLVVVMTKFDAWSHLLEGELTAEGRLPSVLGPAKLPDGRSVEGFDFDVVKRVSKASRAVLVKHAQPLLARIEALCDPSQVWFVPVSATGCSAFKNETGGFSHPGDRIQPVWSQVPMMAMLSIVAPQLLPTLVKKPRAAAAQSDSQPGAGRPADAARESTVGGSAADGDEPATVPIGRPPPARRSG